jgi:hypothetical protein
MLEMKFKTIQNELELTSLQGLKRSMLKTKRDYAQREIQTNVAGTASSFVHLSHPSIESKQQSVHDREQSNHGAEADAEESDQVQARSAQLEANLALAQETNGQALVDSRTSTARTAGEIGKS